MTPNKTMKNLLASHISRDDLAGILTARPALLPPLGADVWRRTAQNPDVRSLLAPLRARALRERDEPLPVLTDDLYADFSRTGRRVPFETVYFGRRRILARTAICALLADEADQDAWMPSLITKLEDIYAEVSWAIPAHVDSLKGLPPGQVPMTIDLFSAETANLMGEMISVFGAVLPRTLIEDIKLKLRVTIFENYLQNHQNMGWADCTNNWNAVCHQGVLGAALAVEDDPHKLAQMLLTAKKHLPRFLEGYGSDGGSSEGPGYWEYGFGWLSVLNEQLETASGGALSLMEGSAHVHEIALFYPRAAFSNGYRINFADGAAHGIPNPRLLCYLGERWDDDLLRGFGRDAYRQLLQSGIALDALRCDFFYLARLLRDCPEQLPREVLPAPGNFYFRDLQVLTVHQRDTHDDFWEFAAKGGHNAEHHNHNDCGSYLLLVNGSPVVTEIGAPEYNKDFFGPKRYENLAARTLGHSLPLVNGCEQAEGAEFAARVLEEIVSPGHIRFDVDLTHCYPPEAGCDKLIRRFHFDAAAGIFSVTDEFTLSKVVSFETAIITNQRVENEAEVLLIVSSSERIALSLGENTHADAVTEHHYQDHQAADATIRRIVLKPDILTERGSVRYFLSVS